MSGWLGSIICCTGGMCEKGNGKGEKKKVGRRRENGRTEADGCHQEGREKRVEVSLACIVKEHELQD